MIDEHKYQLCYEMISYIVWVSLMLLDVIMVFSHDFRHNEKKSTSMKKNNIALDALLFFII